MKKIFNPGLKIFAGHDPEVFNSGNADVDCDGSVGIVDALIIAQHYVGIISGFCI